MSATDLSNAEALETAAEKSRRVAEEAVMIAAAEASLGAGRVVSQEQFDAWAERLLEAPDRPHPTPI